ncbi:hypothetical protein Poli38472_004254 [Pythium oligandrum]|uniref:PDZ domain-containing protein n=1 Tax=Pythium oligandrum TaxID=41045 RepID=A0A8K1CN07_PYTOL|nr:hypothetical protein Poli38472_004254 [Pythium oligandrum]|eukprot:TMW66489.1 hypothetical protein Poli38472_004254 [Pythium oligandrum]
MATTEEDTRDEGFAGTEIAATESPPPSPASSDEALEFELAIERTDKGFGIVFAKQEQAGSGNSSLFVDGFVEDEDAGDSTDKRIAALQSQLQLGDTLVGVNEADCRAMDTMEVVGLLRAAAVGSNTLRFSRLQGRNSAEGNQADQGAGSIKGSFMGALMKVRSRIKAEIEGDEEELIREQQENELYEQQWLAEFERCKAEHHTKWETCTYTANEFCGFLFHSSDEQQKVYLLREFPMLMEPWRDVDLKASSLRNRPDWPAARIAHEDEVTYCSLQSPTNSSINHQHTPMVDYPRPPRTIQSSPSLLQALESLRTEFMWSVADISALNKRLEAEEVSSCQDLVMELQRRHSAHFERHYQSRAYPRLTKSICRALERHARELEQRDEHLEATAPCMEPFKINP